MRYITRNHPAAAGVWALCADGQLVESFVDVDDARGRSRAVRALVREDGEAWTIIAAAEPATDEDMVPWTGSITSVGIESGDRRIVDAGGVSFRQFPLPFLAQIETQWMHDGAVLCGRIDQAVEAGEKVPATGVIDVSTEFGAMVCRMVATNQMNGVSIDPGGGRMETEVTERDDEGWPTNWLDHYVEVEIAAATLCTVPAFKDARIDLDDPAAYLARGIEEDAAAASNRKSGLTLLTASGDIPLNPPLEWFVDPELDGLTRWTVTDEGQVFGHLAPWGQCHISFQQECILAPHSMTDYGWFKLGRLKCAEGCRIDIGTLTMDTGHADKRLTARAAAGHYDNTGFAFADVNVGEDEYGVWVAGALRPSVVGERLRAVEAAKLSGDWRGVNGNLELVATLAVNVPGFPTYEESLAADGSVQTMLASLMPSGAGVLPKQLQPMAPHLLATLEELHVEKLRGRVHSHS